MLKVCVIILVLLAPVSVSAERIYGQFTPTPDGAYIDLRSSDGSSATITADRGGSFDVYTTRSTDQFIGDLNRSQQETAASIRDLDRSLNGDHD